MTGGEPIFDARDPQWIAHRWDRPAGAIRFAHVPRARHAATPFLTDDGIGDAPVAQALVADALNALAPPPHAPTQAGPAGGLHFLLHSAFCASTLLCRAFDAPGLSMGLSEPVILNDIVGFRRRRECDARASGAMFDTALALLARPWSGGEAVVVKPSNIINPVAAGLLTLRADARAILLYAPLPVFLASVARKGMWCRLWVRELLDGLIADGAVQLGFAPTDYFRLTDLQCAAVGWLAQHQLFHQMAARFGAQRVRSLNSEVFLASPVDAMAAAAQHFALAGDGAALGHGPAFAMHSKFGTQFSTQDRLDQQSAAAAVHGEEVEKVAIWAQAVADGAGIGMALPNPLIA
ncbi:MAG: hypothetical protein ACKOUM_12415 [Sphingopyxis sp.]